MKKDTRYQLNMAVFMILYSGEYEVIRRHVADGYNRFKAEIEVEKHIQLRDKRRGRLVSKTFPHYLLEFILNDNLVDGLIVGV